MDFLKLKKFRNIHKPIVMNVTQDQPMAQQEEPKNRTGEGKSVNVDLTNAEIEDDDDDFITNEVKRRLKELRRNSFMVLIPEETCPADEEEEEDEEIETSSSEWRDVEAEGRQFWSGFEAVFDIYCERMLFFDRLSSQQLLEVGSHIHSTPSPRSGSKKFPSPLRCLSSKEIESPPKEEIEQLRQPVTNPYYNLETAYVAQVCLSWEALHCQYTQLNQKISYQHESQTCYNHSAQQFQQFQVMLQRFIENEPFEMGSRPEIYARARKSLPNLLQVPKIQASDEKETGDDTSEMVLGPDLTRIIESSILNFRQFIKMDNKKSGGIRKLHGNQNQIQSSFEKKEVKLKELWKKNKSYKRTTQDMEMLLGLVDFKILSRVLRMSKISKKQLFWCEEKMNKLAFLNGKLQRDPSPLLFPC